MPPFLYTILLVSAFLWWVVFRILTKTAPTTFNILIFLLVFFVTLVLTLSFPIYFWLHKKAFRFTKLREIYRKGIKISAFTSACIVSIMALKAFDVLNIITFVLIVALFATIFWQTRILHK